MNRFYKLIVIPCLVIITIGVMSGFHSETNEELAQRLIEKRTSILQQAFLGRITDEAAISQLKEIETSPIYNRDVDNVKNMVETDLDIVRGTEFSAIEQKVKMYSYLNYDMNIKWTMRGLKGDYTTMGRYSIIIKKVDDQYKLSEFLIIQ